LTPFTQLTPHDPAKGQAGDCWRTCIACLFDLNPLDVPDFADGSIDGMTFDERTQGWLHERGLTRVELPFTGEFTADEVMGCIGGLNPEAYYILAGAHPHLVGSTHSVVCKGNRIVHDPAQEPATPPLAGPSPTGHWWVSFFSKRF
jgi:hypothetical protein